MEKYANRNSRQRRWHHIKADRIGPPRLDRKFVTSSAEMPFMAIKSGCIAPTQSDLHGQHLPITKFGNKSKMCS